MSDVYRHADLMLYPSTYREGVPKVLIEAAASEVPIVTFDAPGCREIVRDGENGYLVLSGEPKAIRAQVQYLLQHPSVRRRMGKKGRALVKDRFTTNEVVEQTMDVYRELLLEG